MALVRQTDTILINSTGRAYEGVRVQAYIGVVEQQLYSDDAGTPLAACITDENGLYDFWIEEGDYTLSFSVNGAVLGDGEYSLFNLARASYLPINVKTYGAKGDGVTDDTAAINAAIAAAVAQGGGGVVLPAGDYLVSNSNPGAANWDNKRAIYIGGDNIRLAGEGRGAVTIRLANGTNGHAIKIGQRETSVVLVDNVSIEEITIDGNRANQSVPTDADDHWNGVDVSSLCTNIHVKGLIIHDTQTYGVGMQRTGISNSSITDCVIYDTGDDAIDWKNDDGDGYGNVVSGVTASNCALEASLTGQKAAFDFRSGIFWSDLTFTGTTGKVDTVGLRVQVDANSTDNVIPAYPTRGRGAVLRGTNGAASYGVRLTARATRASGIVATAFTNGARISAPECSITEFDFYSNGTGVFLTAGDTANADIFHLSNGQVRANTTAGVVMDNTDEASVSSVDVRSNGIGLDIRAGSNNNRIRDGSCTGNTTGLSNAGTATMVANVAGLRTASNTSATFLVDSTGTKTVTIAHGLAVTPSKGEVALSVEENTVVNDWSYNTMRIISTDSTNVTAKLFVSGASVTAGATAILRAHNAALAV